MAASSLPHYPTRPKRVQSPEGNGVELVSARRMTSLWIRAIWLVGIWGALFAFRSVLLSQEINDHASTIVGTWEATDGSECSLVFECGQISVFLGDEVLVRGTYKQEKDGTISTTRRAVGIRSSEEWDMPYARFEASVSTDGLTINRVTPSSFRFFTKAPEGAPLHFKRKR
jgi:hypothetical protein